MNLFLDASVVLAACGRPSGASRAVFDLALRNGWTLMTSPYVVSEVTRNLPRLPAQAALDWAQFGSEGQKRSIAIALKMAQAEYLTGLHGTAPILLIDDVMGELDAKRRNGFLPLLEQAHRSKGQVFMTCTEENWPRELGLEMQRWEVRAGKLGAVG